MYDRPRDKFDICLVQLKMVSVLYLSHACSLDVSFMFSEGVLDVSWMNLAAYSGCFQLKMAPVLCVSHVGKMALTAGNF